ncbi:MAG TPA: hypothetical protein PKE69_27165, partial [Pyrinomonadaceae bacterium]|nr:hypothetical protein [Pyrinomonadaceae bacterium]
RKKKMERWGAEPIVGVAISLGGMTLFQWAQKYPSDFNGVVLINISLPQINAISDRFDLARIGRLLPLFLFLKGEKKEELVFRLTSNIDDAEKKKILARWVEIEKKYPISVKSYLLDLLNRLSTHRRFPFYF